MPVYSSLDVADQPGIGAEFPGVYPYTRSVVGGWVGGCASERGAVRRRLTLPQGTALHAWAAWQTHSSLLSSRYLSLPAVASHCRPWTIRQYALPSS